MHVPQLVVLATLLTPISSAQRWPRPDERLVCGPMVLDVYVSRTAHLFHIVDQLSAWDNACHGQYRAHISLSSEDEDLLSRYVEVRVKKRWGQGLEQTFYTPLDLDDAVRAGKKQKHITSEEARTILPVLEHFAPRVEELMEAKREILEKAFGTVNRDRLSEAARQLSSFTGVKKLTVPVFPLASPTAGGGGMDGGRLKWELSSPDLHQSVLIHELTHAFLMECDDVIDKIVAATPGLTKTLIGEGIAYAFAPGIYGEEGGDNLKYNVTKDLANDEAWEDPTYGRQRIFALALRPILRDTLAAGSGLEEFLPRAQDVFLALREVFELGQRPPGPPRLAIAGPARDIVRERLLDSKYQYWIHRFNHDRGSYDEVIGQLGEGDLLVLLVIKGEERVPPAFSWLLPVTPQELERRLGRGETVTESKSADRGFQVVLLAAPTQADLEELARSTAAIGE